MAGNDNILQAPAEGFGQQVTFATRPGETPYLDGMGREGQSRSGVVGSPGLGSGVGGAHIGAAGIEAPPPNVTMALIQRVGGQYMQQRIKEEKAAAFITGMQRAAGGEAIKDIVEGEPWYANIFGESDVVEGARTYTAQAKAAEAAGAIEDAMPEVRKMDPAQANAYFTQLVAKSMTGDDVTDASLMQGFARMLPGTMRRQAKEHYAWRQEEASIAESNALLSAADLLQKRAAAGVQTDDEYATQAVQFIAGMRPAQGRDVESWTKARTKDLIELAQAGKFHAVAAIKHAGLLDLLNPDQRTRVESALDTAENKTIANKSFEYAGEIGVIAGQAKVFSTDLSAESSLDKLKALNDRFRKETGIDRDLITLTQGSRVAEDATATILREGERRIRVAEEDAKEKAKAGDKEAADLTLKLGAVQAIGLGQAGPASRAKGMSSVVDEQFNSAFKALAPKGPDAQAQMLMQNYTGNGTGDGYVSKDVKEMFERRAAVAVGAQMPADLLKLHEEYAALKRQSPALADAYFGNMADRMWNFDAMLTDGPPGSRNESQAYAASFGTEPPRRKPLSDKERVSVGETLAAQHDSPAWKFWKQQREPLREDQLDYAATDIGDAVSRFRSLPNVTVEQATQRAYLQRQRDAGADMVGGFYIRGAAGQQPLTNILRTHRPGDSAKGTGEDAPGVWDKALKGKVSQLAEKYGVSAGDPITIVRNPDKGGVAWLDVYFTASDGRQLPVRLSSDDIKNYARDPRG